MSGVSQQVAGGLSMACQFAAFNIYMWEGQQNMNLGNIYLVCRAPCINLTHLTNGGTGLTGVQGGGNIRASLQTD